MKYCICPAYMYMKFVYNLNHLTNHHTYDRNICRKFQSRTLLALLDLAVLATMLVS